MANRLKLKLPTLLVTQRSTTGEVSQRRIPRGCVQGSPGVSHPSHPGPDDGYQPSDEYGGDHLTSDVGGGMGVENLPSLHCIAQRSAVESWDKVRPHLLRAAIESSAMPPDQTCITCCANEAMYRCLQCGPRAFFCHCCFSEVHSATKYRRSMGSEGTYDNLAVCLVSFTDFLTHVRDLVIRAQCLTLQCGKFICMVFYSTCSLIPRPTF